MSAYIQHIQLCSRHGLKYVQKFVQNANFNLFAERSTDSLKQWAVRSGSTVFVINQPVQTCDHPPDLEHQHDQFSESCMLTSDSSTVGVCNAEHNIANRHDSPRNCQTLPPSCFSSSKDQNVDSVFNVAFEVGNVEQFVERAHTNGARILCQPTVVHDDSGKVVIASVQSCIGNVVHTILNTKDYQGVFLPGFCSSSNTNLKLNHPNNSNVELDEKERTLTTHLDHVTFACGIGSSSHILDWYERCFGMNRFRLSSDESESEGFLVEGQNVGLRMKAMEYWRCSEIGISMPEKDTGKHPKTKFVIAEALPGQGPNQVETFLQDHGGPGIQHIGLYAPNIMETVKVLTNTGLDFIQPPGAYYTEIGKLNEMVQVGENPDDLKQLGILLDAESFVEDTEENKGSQAAMQCNRIGGSENNRIDKYLMQIFTKPIFDRDTFFLEIIQRCGATGFGAGNITALWRAVEHYMQKNKASEKNI